MCFSKNTLLDKDVDVCLYAARISGNILHFEWYEILSHVGWSNVLNPKFI